LATITKERQGGFLKASIIVFASLRLCVKKKQTFCKDARAQGKSFTTSFILTLFNAFVFERPLINSEDFEVNRKGVQVAGFLNYVLNHTSGIQVSGGLNVVGNNFKGIQLAGVGKSAGGTSIGLQLAGTYNLQKNPLADFS
jgi:hypothetical protein